MSEDRPAFATSARDGVLEVVLDRPDRRNPLDYGAVLELVGHLEAADRDPAVRAVLVRGEGTGFCSGGDLREFEGALSSSAQVFHDGGEGWVRLMTMIPDMRIPVVVAAHGYALAGGCGIVAAADVALAAATTSFGTSEVRIGLFPIVVLPVLGRAVGLRRARELALTGRRIDAAEAHAIGLVHRVLPDEGFIEAARAVAADLASLGPDAIRLGKQLLRDIDDVPLRQASTLAQAMRGVFMSTEDFAEGVSAFNSKRPPVFGRSSITESTTESAALQASP
jgi:enoyl-CoA hydratase/carnithine racemase